MRIVGAAVFGLMMGAIVILASLAPWTSHGLMDALNFGAAAFLGYWAGSQKTGKAT